jgi:hypothetical protein
MTKGQLGGFAWLAETFATWEQISGWTCFVAAL